MERTIRPMKLSQAGLMIDYFLSGTAEFLDGMGVDPKKLPTPDKWLRLLEADFAKPLESKQFYYVVWEIDRVPIGHSNINNIKFGQQAFMHLHIWNSQHRQSGNARFFLEPSIAKYFELFELQKLYCEPYALNPAPNKILPQLGFQLIKSYETTPGWIAFHQPVNLWELKVSGTFSGR